MTLIEIRLLLDSSMVVLIWMIQLIVYPSFKYCNKEHLVGWHQKYSNRLAGIVIPLMLGQLVISIYQLYATFNYDRVIYALSVWTLWISTFLIFVPLHKTIASGNSTSIHLKQLVRKNWLRTILWSLLLLYSLYYKLSI
ncbi:MAG: hypothetical protein ACI9KI_000705 [Patiriisocius sp.]|jgi:hypothetical protein